MRPESVLFLRGSAAAFLAGIAVGACAVWSGYWLAERQAARELMINSIKRHQYEVPIVTAFVLLVVASAILRALWLVME